MFGAFLSHTNRLMGRRFLVSSWFPTLLAAVVAANILLATRGWRSTLDEAASLSTATGIWGGVAAFAVLTATAFLLHVAPVIRAFEGYTLPAPLAAWGRRRQIRLRDKGPERVRLLNFPRNAELIRPTRLGNIITSAEEHAYLRYRMDSVVWWPRFTHVLPTSCKDHLDDILLPLVALLHVSLMFGALSLATPVWCAWWGCWELLPVSLATGVVSFVAYRAALVQAAQYADGVRSAFDLYRHDLLTALRYPLPERLVDERRMWDVLTQWIYRGQAPDDTNAELERGGTPPPPLTYQHPPEAPPVPAPPWDPRPPSPDAGP